jgi:hypothetical protein
MAMMAMAKPQTSNGKYTPEAKGKDSYLTIFSQTLKNKLSSKEEMEQQRT